jgi:hypothetical protein
MELVSMNLHAETIYVSWINYKHQLFEVSREQLCQPELEGSKIEQPQESERGA